MATVYNYRVWCNVDAKYEYAWAEVEPTVCPVNTAHAIDTVKTSIIGQEGDAEPKTSDGARYTAVLPGKPGRKMVIKGTKFDAAVNATTDNDLTFGETREIQGAWLEVANAQPGDYLDLHICDPDGVSVGQHGESVYIPPSGKIEQVISEGTASFPPGYKLRARYVAVDAGTTRTVYCWYRMRK